MPRARRSSILGGMDDMVLTLALELHISGDSISGRATADDGEVVEFDGWLGLLGVIDSLVLSTTDATSRRDT